MFYSRLIIILLVISMFLACVGAHYALEWLCDIAKKAIKKIVIYVSQLHKMRKNNKKRNHRYIYNRVSTLSKTIYNK